AIPGRRGKPGGVDSTLRRTASPAESLSTRPPTCSDARASARRSALCPSHTIAAPPRATSGRHSSAATGGFARAFASATPNASVGCSSARPHTTSTFGSSEANLSRSAHFLRSASSNEKLRSGRAAARGMPGLPPPDPTSTIGPGSVRTSGTARKASSRRARRASSMPSHPVAPGDSSTASSQRSKRSAVTSAREVTGKHDDEAVGLGALARGLDFRIVLERLVDDLALDRRHRLQRDGPVGRGRAFRGSTREVLERRRAPSPVAGSVDDYVVAIAVRPRDRVREVLNRIDRLAVLADEERDVGTGAGDGDLVLVLARGHGDVRTDAGRDPLHDLPRLPRQVALVVRARCSRSRLCARDHVRRAESHTQQAALALRHHLELDGIAVEAGHELLELTKRSPL